MIIYECDMCGKQAQSIADFLEVSFFQPLQFLRVKQFMVCRKCGNLIVEFVENFKRNMGGADEN